MAVNKKWTKHLTLAEDKERFKESLREARHILKVLSDLVQENIDKNQSDALKEENYLLPSWQLKQADLVGETRAYKKVQELIKNSLT